MSILYSTMYALVFFIAIWRFSTVLQSIASVTSAKSNHFSFFKTAVYEYIPPQFIHHIEISFSIYFTFIPSFDF